MIANSPGVRQARHAGFGERREAHTPGEQESAGLSPLGTNDIVRLPDET